MHRSVIVLLLLGGLLPAGLARAQNDEARTSRMLHGATTLPRGDTAFSLEGGLDLPGPLFYTLRLDHGVRERWQIGISGSYIGIVGAATAHNVFRLAQSDDRRHSLALEADVGFFHVVSIFSGDDAQSLLLRAALAYEWRTPDLRTGLFVKAGSMHIGGGKERSFGRALGDTTGTWGHLGRATLGVHHALNARWSLGLSGTFQAPAPFGLGKAVVTHVF